MAAKYANNNQNQHGQRFSDMAEESCQMLTPIQGYENKPLVSLEEAVKPVISLVPDVERMAFVAKHKCQKNPANNLSIDESASIILYSMDWQPQEQCLYHVLNRTLREKNRGKLKPWFLYLKLILTALFRLPSSHYTVFRGIKQDLRKDYQEGETIYWWGFSSCTTTIGVLKDEEFLGSSGTRTLFTIDCFSGKNIQKHSDYQNEDEVLLLPGRQFKVVSCLEQGKDLYVIQLKEIKPDFPLLESFSLPDDVPEKLDPISIPTPLAIGPVRITGNSDSIQSKAKNDSGQITIVHNPPSDLPLKESSDENKKNKNDTHINSTATWKPCGFTIAGGNEAPNEVYQFFKPQGIYVDDDDQWIYIADYWNHRIVKWNYKVMNGTIVAGGCKQGNRIYQLNQPRNMVVDKKNKDSLIICDYGNKRVVRCSLRNYTDLEIIIPNIDCHGLVMDNNGDLYVSDCVKNEVRRWTIGDKNGTLVAGGNGKGNKLNQLNYPTYICVDRDYSVYVSDLNNHRVIKWMKDATEGIVVAGGQGQGHKLSQLYYPNGVFVDHEGSVYIADSHNHRIMRWLKESKEGNIIVGGKGPGKQPNQLNYPAGLSFDRQGNLYIADWENQRVQKFDIFVKSSPKFFGLFKSTQNKINRINKAT